jgi:hypothetical protein
MLNPYLPLLIFSGTDFFPLLKGTGPGERLFDAGDQGMGYAR